MAAAALGNADWITTIAIGVRRKLSGGGTTFLLGEKNDVYNMNT